MSTIKVKRKLYAGAGGALGMLNKAGKVADNVNTAIGLAQTAGAIKDMIKPSPAPLPPPPPPMNPNNPNQPPRPPQPIQPRGLSGFINGTGVPNL